MTRRTPASPAASSPTAAIKSVDPEAWSLARLYANGDVRRLQVIDERTVLVRNS